jgi:hypothetical protein
MSAYRDMRDQFSSGELALIDAAINYDGTGFGVTLGSFVGWVMTYSGSRCVDGPAMPTAKDAMVAVVARYSREGLANAYDPLAKRA